MKNLKKKTVTAAVFAIALALLLAITARAAVAQDAKPASGNLPVVAEGIASQWP